MTLMRMTQSSSSEENVSECNNREVVEISEFHHRAVRTVDLCSHESRQSIFGGVFSMSDSFGFIYACTDIQGWDFSHTVMVLRELNKKYSQISFISSMI